MGWFWMVVASFTPDERRSLLQFITGRFDVCACVRALASCFRFFECTYRVCVWMRSCLYLPYISGVRSCMWFLFIPALVSYSGSFLIHDRLFSLFLRPVIPGSGALPPNGFSELQPQLQICASGEPNSLPTSHTCFNQLCLPTYDSMENLQRSLSLAITEGAQGFGFA